MAEDCLRQPHHLSVCLSAHEPSAAILSLNYCTQHIPVNHTHAYMHTRTCVLNSKHLNMKHCRAHNCSSITLIHDLMGHIFLYESTNNILLTSKITSAEQFVATTTLSDDEELLLLPSIFHTFHLNHLNHYDTHPSCSHTCFSHSHKTLCSYSLGSLKNKLISKTHKEF